MEIKDTPLATLDKVSIGCMGPLPLPVKGNKYNLSCQDQLSK
jgi:hypothetical protein